MAALYDVLRPISGPDGAIDCGQTVDVSDWRPRNVRMLVERRYLRPSQPASVPAPAAHSGKPSSGKE